MGITAILTAASLFAASAAPAPAVDRQVVEQALDQLTSDGGVLGVQVRIMDGRQQFTARSGAAELDTTKPVPYNGKFRIGSVTKPFVSTVVLQLVGEGKAELDAPIARYLSDLLPHKEITVRQVLQHTSGLFSYTRALPLSPDGFEPIRDKHWEESELVAIAAERPLNFPPGTKWEYSNTNYIVAGMLIEKLTGRTYPEAIEQRILKPLRLNDTYLPGDEQNIRGPHAHAYWTANGKPSDITHINPSVTGASGEMVSTTRDLDTFIVALTSGKLLKPAQQAELTRTTEVSRGYGLGLKVMTVCGTKVWGHGGGIPGFSTELFTTSDNRRRLVMSATTAPVSGTPRPALDKLLNATFC
ncbi:D-alanyl-D-alanine carboxypeptidase [Lentzea atacamensis]|uniref:D-alanyl-D-alanine carboxypeptidase n=1 Tax=Lentzea atacamensis TaxID=531938 RepID=A0A316HJM4_9PSEU|nr:serine hydrolase domain-containing protein [Lentzea atacamensis]PWK80861.1 D-alanyl-D-alanine carboxypeptidase [Lentzea atacamensis]